MELTAHHGAGVPPQGTVCLGLSQAQLLPSAAKVPALWAKTCPQRDTFQPLVCDLMYELEGPLIRPGRIR